MTVGLVRDASGEPVRSRLDEPGLRAIAQAADGTYRPLGADGRGLDRLYDEVLAPLAHTEQAARVRRVYAEWFAVPLALSIFGIVLDALLGWRPRSRSRTRRSGGAPSALRMGALAAVGLMLLLPTRADASVRDAEKAYAAGKFEDAAHAYAAEQAAHPKDARLAIDAGAAAYRAAHYDAAEAAFAKALTSADPKLQERVLYDLGDARYRGGATSLADAPDKTKEQWKAAISAYEGALALTPSDADAAYNRDFVKRKLAELESKQKPQPQDSQTKKDGDQGSKGEASKGGAGKPAKDASAKNGGTSEKSSGGASSGKDSQASRDGSQSTAPGQQPSTDKPSDDSSKSQGPGSVDARDRQASTSGAQGASSNGDRPGQRGTSGEQGASGQLSPSEARVLLGSLRGDERRGVTTATSGAPVTTDSPRKDW